MTRAQRRLHVHLWLVLGPLILIGFFAALGARPRASLWDAFRSDPGAAEAGDVPFHKPEEGGNP
ncbi:MAG: hypothetical protein FLDDKLPJ_01763 [Phycisphaerae bacterium]|nr:hypothetical protein [Phycisphaerae bacterium]